MNCSNCSDPIEVTDAKALVVTTPADVHLNVRGEKLIFAALCSACQKDVLTMKIVLSRKQGYETDPFVFEGYLPVAVAK